MKLSYIKRLATLLLALFIFMGLRKLVRGDSNFLVTVSVYLLAVVLVVWAFRKWKVGEAIWLSVFSLLFALFLAEVGLRFVLKRHLTYIEKNGGQYSSPYDYGQRYSRWVNDQYDEDDSSKGRLLLFAKNEYRNYALPECYFPPEKMNRLGLRGLLPPKTKKVICALGDSFTESIGAPADSTYPALWQQLLPCQDSLAVLNAGVSGSDPFYAFILLQELAKQYTIHSAVFLVNESDVIDCMWRGGEERFLPDGGVQFSRGPWWEPLYAFSMVFRLIIHDGCGIGWNLMRPEEEHRAKEIAVKTIANYFEQKIVPWCKARQIVPVVVTHPFLPYLKQSSTDYLLLQSAVGAVVLPTYYDLAIDAQQWPAPQKMYWPQDGHFNSSGYASVAHLIHQNVGKVVYPLFLPEQIDRAEDTLLKKPTVGLKARG